MISIARRRGLEQSVQEMKKRRCFNECHHGPNTNGRDIGWSPSPRSPSPWHQAVGRAGDGVEIPVSCFNIWSSSERVVSFVWTSFKVIHVMDLLTVDTMCKVTKQWFSQEAPPYLHHHHHRQLRSRYTGAFFVVVLIIILWLYSFHRLYRWSDYKVTWRKKASSWSSKA